MIYNNCQLIKLDPIIEEGGLFKINGYKIYCFIIYSPFKIYNYHYYQIELNLDILEDEVLIQLSEKDFVFKQINDSFLYKITGILQEKKIILPKMEFDDDFGISYDYSDMIGKKISLTVNRINISILKEIF